MVNYYSFQTGNVSMLVLGVVLSVKLCGMLRYIIIEVTLETLHRCTGICRRKIHSLEFCLIHNHALPQVLAITMNMSISSVVLMSQTF